MKSKVTLSPLATYHLSKIAEHFGESDLNVVANECIHETYKSINPLWQAKPENLKSHSH